MRVASFLLNVLEERIIVGLFYGTRILQQLREIAKSVLRMLFKKLRLVDEAIKAGQRGDFGLANRIMNGHVDMAISGSEIVYNFTTNVACLRMTNAILEVAFSRCRQRFTVQKLLHRS
jgi:hypothetical protein